MRQILFATVLMLVGMVLATLFAFFLASTWSSFSDRWLIPITFLPAIGVATGCWLSHKTSNEQDPWPITTTGGRLLYTLLGALGSAAAGYFVYIALSAAWFHADFFEMALDPSKIKTFSETTKYGQHESTPVGNIFISLFVGAYGTFRLIKEKLTD
ncbi:MAG: hypothetical protein HY291_02985 [Planctomycetes bacterium]|nr:hypothetical protein [Planctomycetota bacterium]